MSSLATLTTKAYRSITFLISHISTTLMGLGHSRSFLDHTQTHHTRQNFSGRVTGTSQRHLPDKIQQPQVTCFHARDGIRTLNPRNRAVAEPRFTPPGHCHWRSIIYPCEIPCAPVCVISNYMCSVRNTHALPLQC